MRPLTLIGILLTGLGGFILFRGLTYSSQRSVLKLGDFEAARGEALSRLGSGVSRSLAACFGLGVGLRGRGR